MSRHNSPAARSSFDGAILADDNVDFSGSVFSGGLVILGSAVYVRCKGLLLPTPQVYFLRARFSDGQVDFGAVFSGGKVSFDGARFASGEVNFLAAEFTGSQVDFSSAADWSNPPKFALGRQARR